MKIILERLDQHEAQISGLKNVAGKSFAGTEPRRTWSDDNFFRRVRSVEPDRPIDRHRQSTNLTRFYPSRVNILGDRIAADFARHITGVELQTIIEHMTAYGACDFALANH